MKQVILHGRLADQFGSTPTIIDIGSTGEAVRALSAIHLNFRNEIRKGSYHVVLKNGETVMDIGHEDISLNLGAFKEVHIIPVIEGAKQSGIMKILLGVVLAAGAFFLAPAAGLGATAFGISGMGITYGQIAMAGVALAIAGAASMLAPDNSDNAKNDNSYIYGNPDNTSDQGVPVPVVIGRFLTGSVVMSMGVSTEQIGTDGITYPSQG